MKTVLLLGGILLIAGTTTTYAQCDKKVVVTSSKTEHLGADSTVQRTDDESVTVEFNKDTLNVAISSSNGNQNLAGKVKSYSCDWSTPFKEGKTVLKATMTNENGESRDLSITVTGKAGKIGFLAEVEGEPDRIRLVVDKFEEKK
jgi:hypothetical protein